MLRRSRIGSQSAVERPCTDTCPLVGSSNRLISFSSVVLPLPLRPSTTSVSPIEMDRETSATSACGEVRPTLYVTSRNSMVLWVSVPAFAFISIDSSTRRGDHHTSLCLPALKFGASFRRKRHPTRRGNPHGSY